MNGVDVVSAGCRMATPEAALIPRFIDNKRRGILKNKNKFNIKYKPKNTIILMELNYILYQQESIFFED
jgi:hypothetical protein